LVSKQQYKLNETNDNPDSLSPRVIAISFSLSIPFRRSLSIAVQTKKDFAQPKRAQPPLVKVVAER